MGNFPVSMFRLFYNCALPVIALLATPFWLWKTRKRGGLSTRLWEKLGLYGAESPPPDEGVVYLHAVSVGEANIALKLAARWREMHPGTRFILAPGTSTGFDLARKSESDWLCVIYAPLDLTAPLRAMMERYRPARIVLIEHEVWPNMMVLAEKRGIPVALANARLSPRSGQRLAKLRPVFGPFYARLDWVGAQVDADVGRLAAIGIPENLIETTGSIKFDPATLPPVTNTFDPRPFLTAMGQGPVVMALSTHAGEELLFARAAAKVSSTRIVIIPRHMERRNEIARELDAAGFPVAFRSTRNPVDGPLPEGTVLLVDSTGEMPAWTEAADVVFVGKTLLATGGQNPCEAIAAGVPVVAGPHLENFEPLASELRQAGGLRTVLTEDELSAALQELLTDSGMRERQSSVALEALEVHRGATDRTIGALAQSASLRT